MWGSKTEVERRKRIMVAVYAYAYEIKDNPIVSDATYDALAMSLNLSTSTGDQKLDKWFLDNYSEFTGQWIHKHPNKAGLERIYKVFTPDDSFLD